MKRHSESAPATTDTAEPKPFASARRIWTHDDLPHDSEDAPIIAPGEVLVFFTYMEGFDAEAWRESTMPYMAWAMEAVDHDASLEYMGEELRALDNNDGSWLFSGRDDYGFGIALSETWLLPEDEYAAAFEALVAAAQGAEDKAFWLGEKHDLGYHSRSYDKDTSLFILSFLLERLQPNTEAVHMSTELMREHFPFLGTGL